MYFNTSLFYLQYKYSKKFNMMYPRIQLCISGIYAGDVTEVVVGLLNHALFDELVLGVVEDLAALVALVERVVVCELLSERLRCGVEDAHGLVPGLLCYLFLDHVYQEVPRVVPGEHVPYDFLGRPGELEYQPDRRDREEVEPPVLGVPVDSHPEIVPCEYG